MNRKAHIEWGAPHRDFLIFLLIIFAIALWCLLVDSAGAQTVTRTAATSTAQHRTFATPQQAADALIDAAEKFDVAALEEIFGPEGRDIIRTGEDVQDREQAAAFAALGGGKEKSGFALQKKKPARVAVPTGERGGKWSFDAKAGRQQILYRRVGRNELDVIEICRGFVEAQHEYALVKRDGSGVNQYAQRLISTPGKQDGSGCQLPGGMWGGPVGC